MCQNAVIWYFVEKGRDMDLCSTFTTRFEGKIIPFNTFKS
jgi:hypothetical protein